MGKTQTCISSFGVLSFCDVIRMFIWFCSIVVVGFFTDCFITMLRNFFMGGGGGGSSPSVSILAANLAWHIEVNLLKHSFLYFSNAHNTYCIIRVCHIKRRNVSWAGSKCFIAGHMTSDQLVSELILKASREIA